jgi:GDP-L-fucose synthase
VQGAGELVIWGSGSPLREFLHADDCADALVHLMKAYSEEGHVNVGSGEEIAIAGLASLVADVVGYRGDIVFDRTKPDGTPRKLMSSAKLFAQGWRPRIGLHAGVADTYAWYRNRYQSQVQS